MNVEFFQNMFGTWKGYVYNFVGSLDGVTDIHSYVTGKFAEAIGNNQVICSVVELKPGMVVVYCQDLCQDTEEFKLYFDLLIPTPEPVDSAVAPETPPTE